MAKWGAETNSVPHFLLNLYLQIPRYKKILGPTVLFEKHKMGTYRHK